MSWQRFAIGLALLACLGCSDDGLSQREGRRARAENAASRADDTRSEAAAARQAAHPDNPAPVAPGAATATLGARAATRLALPESPTKTAPLILRRHWEPTARAFSFLAPAGWEIEARAFRVNPVENGGEGNSVLSKHELLVRSEDGACLLQSLPLYVYADFRGSKLPHNEALCPIGTNYVGMEVRPLVPPGDFLDATVRALNPQATGLRRRGLTDLTELAAEMERANSDYNRFVATLGERPFTCAAAAAVYEYTDRGVKYRETLAVALMDGRAGLACWWNEKLIRMRAPADRYDSLRPAFDAIVRSIEVNPEWLARDLAMAGEMGRVLIAAQRGASDAARRIATDWRNDRSPTVDEFVLAVTDQQEYINPYTQKVEVDRTTSGRRWISSQGDVIFTWDGYDPRTDDELWTNEWRASESAGAGQGG